MTDRVFSKYDYVLLNLETNISKPDTGTPAVAKSYTFNAPLEALDQLQNAGVDFVSLANNHTMDYGPKALLEQMQLLDEKEIVHFGAGANKSRAFSPVYQQLEDTKVAFLGFNDAENKWTDAGGNSPGSAYLRRGAEDLVKNAVKVAKQNSDIVIVYAHWGIEGTYEANSDQKYWGRLIVDAGADLVVGAHPHIIHPYEVYKDVYIHYSLGNFIGGGTAEGPRSEGHLLEVYLEDGEIIIQRYRDIKINFQGQAKLAPGRKEILYDLTVGD